MTAANESAINITARQKQLVDLNQNLNILLEREAKYGGNTPLELLNQIEDHRQAIDLIEQALAGLLSEVDLEEDLKSLLLALHNGQVVNINAEIYIAGDQMISQVTIGDVTGGIHESVIAGRDIIIQQARSVAEEAAKAHEIATRRLAEGVIDYAKQLATVAADKSDADAGGPYKGLLAYRLNDAELFFGRQRAIAELLQHLARGRLTILHAESGAGKSSLLQASISPRLLAAGQLPVYLRPYNLLPTLAIKQAFLPNLVPTPELWQAPLRDFLRQVIVVLGPRVTLYLLLDQFEEFFILLNESDQTQFVIDLVTCLEDIALNIRWVLALRTEFFGELANFRPHIRNPFENDMRLNRLTRTEAQQVITEPAKRQNISFESSLVETLLNDLQEHNEVSPPQLQLVCLALYNLLLSPTSSTQQAQVITLQMYQEEGQAQRILAGHLNRVLRRMGNNQERNLARQLLIALISSERRRIRRTHSDLAEALAINSQSLTNLSEQLIQNRLLNVEQDDATNQTSYELAHDYLLTEIELEPEIQARKAAEELLKRELMNWQQFGALMRPQTLKVVEAQRENLHLGEHTLELLLQSAFETNLDLAQWLAAAPQPEMARRILLAGLERSEPELRLRAISHLLPYADEQVTLALEQHAQDNKNEAVQQAALTTLGAYAPERAQKVLLTDLEHPDAARRKQAVLDLKNYLDATVTDKLYSCIKREAEEPVWQAALQTLATTAAAPYRRNWKPLVQTGFWRAAKAYQKLRQWRVELPRSLGWQLLPARLAHYTWNELTTRPLWLAGRVVLVVMLYLAVAWLQSWWPFIRWEAMPGAPSTEVAALRLLIDQQRPENNAMHVGSFDYGLQQYQPATGWSKEWLRAGLPTGEPADENDPNSNVWAIVAIAVDPLTPNHIYSYAKDTGLFRSQDDGSSWQQIGATAVPTSSTPPDVDVFAGQVLLVSGADLYASDNQGETWQKLDGQSGLPEMNFAVARFNAEGTPYAGGEDGLYQGNNDFPWTWQKIATEPVRYLAFGPNAKFYLALGWPLSYRVACYTSGEEIGPPVRFEDNFVTALAADPKTPDLFYASAFGDQIYAVTCAQGKRSLGEVPGDIVSVTGLAVWPEADGSDWLVQTNYLGVYRRRP